MSSDAALRAAQARLAAGENDLRVTDRRPTNPTPVTSVRVTREEFGVAKVTVTVACVVCGRDFVPKRVDARTCSGKCRQQAYRDRQRS